MVTELIGKTFRYQSFLCKVVRETPTAKLFECEVISTEILQPHRVYLSKETIEQHITNDYSTITVFWNGEVQSIEREPLVKASEAMSDEKDTQGSATSLVNMKDILENTSDGLSVKIDMEPDFDALGNVTGVSYVPSRGNYSSGIVENIQVPLMSLKYDGDEMFAPETQPIYCNLTVKWDDEHETMIEGWLINEGTDDVYVVQPSREYNERGAKLSIPYRNVTSIYPAEAPNDRKRHIKEKYLRQLNAYMNDNY